MYQQWVGKRQTCLAHLIRRADGLSERGDPEVAACGKWAAAELRRLCRMAEDPPTKGEWSSFYARLCRLIALYRDSGSDAGKFVRHIAEEIDSLFTSLFEEDAEPTNNLAERMLRFGVLLRSRLNASFRCGRHAGTVESPLLKLSPRPCAVISEDGNPILNRSLCLHEHASRYPVSAYEEYSSRT